MGKVSLITLRLKKDLNLLFYFLGKCSAMLSYKMLVFFSFSCHVLKIKYSTAFGEGGWFAWYALPVL